MGQYRTSVSRVHRISHGALQNIADLYLRGARYSAFRLSFALLLRPESKNNRRIASSRRTVFPDPVGAVHHPPKKARCCEFRRTCTWEQKTTESPGNKLTADHCVSVAFEDMIEARALHCVEMSKPNPHRWARDEGQERMPANSSQAEGERGRSNNSKLTEMQNGCPQEVQPQVPEGFLLD